VAVVFLVQCEKDELNPLVEIPDESFLKALSASGVDKNGDGLMSRAEAEAITYLNISNWFIQDLTGIEAFVNLDTLYCWRNQLTSLNISNNCLLKNLHIENLPDLHEVCVWEMPFPPTGVDVFREGSPNVYFTMDCSK